MIRVTAGEAVTEGDREAAEAAIRQALDLGHSRIVIEVLAGDRAARLADPPGRSYPDAITDPLDPPTVSGTDITYPL